MPIRPNNYLPLTICRTDPWQADVLDAEPSVVTETEHEFSVSDIIASRHGQTVSNKLTAGNLKWHKVVNQRNFIRRQPRKQENFRYPKTSGNCSCDSDDLAYTRQFVGSAIALLLTQRSNKT
jgi:hypothetical protein